MYIMAPTKLTPEAMIKTGNQRPWDCVTNSAVSGPQVIPGIVAYNAEMKRIIIEGTFLTWIHIMQQHKEPT